MIPIMKRNNECILEDLQKRVKDADKKRLVFVDESGIDVLLYGVCICAEEQTAITSSANEGRISHDLFDKLPKKEHIRDPFRQRKIRQLTHF